MSISLTISLNNALRGQLKPIVSGKYITFF